MATPFKNNVKEEAVEVKPTIDSFQTLDVHYPLIAPHPPTANIFSVTTRPRLESYHNHPRLIPPDVTKPAPRFPNFCPNFDSSPYAPHLLVRPAHHNASGLEHDQRFFERLPSPGHSEKRSPRRHSYTTPPESPNFARVLDHLESSAYATRACAREAWRLSCPPVAVPSQILENCLNEITPPASPRRRRRLAAPPDEPPAANTLVPLRLPDGRQAVAFPAHASVRSLTIATLHPQPRLAVHPSPKPPSLLFDNNPVTHVRAADAVGSDPTRLLAATNRDIFFATVQSDHHLRFHDVLNMSVYDAAFSPLTDEVVLLYKDGVHAASSHALSNPVLHDVHPLDTYARFSAIAYSAHPRVLVLGSASALCLFDMRSDSGLSELARPACWRLSPYDNAVASVSMVGASSFQMVAASRSQVLYFDARVPRDPLLRLPYELPSPVSRIATTRLNHGAKGLLDSADDSISDVIAFAAPVHQFLGVAHVAHLSEQSQFHAPTYGAKVGIPAPRVMWDDDPVHVGSLLPLLHLNDCPGMAVLPRDESVASLSSTNASQCCELDVAYWTKSSGLTVLPFMLRTKGEFEGSDDFNMGIGVVDDAADDGSKQVVKEGDNSSLLDSSIRIRNAQHALVAAGLDNGLRDSMVHPVSRGFGAALHSRTQRLPADLSTLALECICDTQADEICDDTRIPRAMMGALGVHAHLGGMEAKAPDVRVAIEESPMTVHEVGQFLREGNVNAHEGTPLADCLGRVLEASPFIVGENAAWHEHCQRADGHKALFNCVSTGETEDVPDWVGRRIYYATGGAQDSEDRDGTMVDDDVGGAGGTGDEEGDQTEYGKMLSRMRRMFFDNEPNEGEQKGRPVEKEIDMFQE